MPIAGVVSLGNEFQPMAFEIFDTSSIGFDNRDKCWWRQWWMYYVSSSSSSPRRRHHRYCHGRAREDERGTHLWHSMGPTCSIDPASPPVDGWEQERERTKLISFGSDESIITHSYKRFPSNRNGFRSEIDWTCLIVSVIVALNRRVCRCLGNIEKIVCSCLPKLSSSKRSASSNT